MNSIRDLYNLFFPEICSICDAILVSNEELLCVECRLELPIAELTDIENNELEQVFYARIAIDFGTSLFYYNRKGVIQKLIHQLKYKGNENLGVLFGKWLGEEMQSSVRVPAFDCVIPVPIARRKLKKRGYNQVTKFAQEIAKVLEADFVDNQLLSESKHETQSKKRRVDRWKNVQDKFYLADTHYFDGKNVLLVDDVITTGATIEACCKELQKSKDISISVAAMAFTS